jgi:hypothetical protein
MAHAARSTLTLAALAAVLALAAVWGWTAATAPFPGKVDTPLCVSRSIDAGSKVYPQDVAVSVYNAGTRDGLAGRTMQTLHDRGFAEADSGNVHTRSRVGAAEIWTTTPSSPAVHLVASYLGHGVRIERRDSIGVGVVIVVGDKFHHVTKGRKSVVATKAATICSPPLS